MAEAQVYGISATIGSEDSYGTLNAAGDGYKVSIVSHSLSVSRNRTEVSEIDGTVTNARPTSGFRTISGDITIRPKPQQIAVWLQYVIATPITTGVGPYTHTYTPSTTAVKSFQMELEYNDITEFELYSGLVCTGVSMSVGGDGQLEFTLSVLGQDKTNAQATGFGGTVTDLTTETDVYDQFEASITSGDTFTSETFNYDLTRAAEQFFPIGNGANASLIFRGKFGVSGTTDILFENDTLFDNARAETATNISLIFTDGTNVLTFANPTVLWDESNIQPSAGEVKVLATMPYIGYGAFTVTAVNGLATIS